MPRTDPYILLIRRETSTGSGVYTDILENGLQLKIEIIPAGNTDLDSPITPTELSYTCGEGDSIPWAKPGYEHLTGVADAMTCIFTLDATKLPSDLAGYIASPRYALGGSLGYGAYSRSFDVSTMFVVWSDRDKTAGDISTLEFCGLQRTGLDQEGVARLGAGVILKVECLDVFKWIMETMRPTDIDAYITTNLSAELVGPFRWVYQDIWSDSGKLYRIQHGDPEHFTTYREYTLIGIDDLFEAIQGVAADIFKEVARRRGPADPISCIFSATANPGFIGTSRSHWSLFEGTYTAAWDRTSTVVDDSARFVCIRIAFNTAPTATFHGFLHTPGDGVEAPEDILASWKTVWDWLADEAGSAGVKVVSSVTENVGEWTLEVRFQRFREAHPTGELALAPADFNGGDITFKVGPQALTGVTVSTPAGGSDDAQPRSFDDPAGTGNDKRWTMPRGFHTNPIAYPDGDRVYRADDTTHADILTQAFNCLTLYTITTAGGLLGASAPVRLHHSAKMHDGVTDWDIADPGISLPTPSISSDWDFSVPRHYPDADTNLGTPYLSAIAGIQLSSGCPIIIGLVMLFAFGAKQNTEYGGMVPFLLCPPGELGNQLDASGFPDGNALLSGATFFGELPGPPFIQAMEGDYLGGQETRVTLLGMVA